MLRWLGGLFAVRLRPGTVREVAAVAEHPDFCARISSDGLNGVLRVDAIKDRALLEMVADWGESDESGETKDVSVINALDALASAVRDGATREEQCARVHAVESAAEMEPAEVRLDLETARRLHAELGRVLEQLERRARLAPVRDGRAA